jgi:choice-of-anchor C domain-containing protein
MKNWLARAGACAWAVALLLGLPGPARANFLVNGSFELPVVGGNFTTRFAGENFGGWVVEFGTIGHVRTLWQHAEGDQSLDLNGDRAGGVYQDFATTAGQAYLIRFALSENPGVGDKHLAVVWEGASIANFTVTHDPGRTGQDMRWAYYEVTAVAQDSMTRLAFHSLTGGMPGAVGFGPFYGPLLDDVSVTLAPAAAAVPEPASVVSLAVGCGCLVVGRRRRRRGKAGATEPCV